MPADEAAVAAPALHHRLRHGIRQPENWVQLFRFGVVGASGYVVNLAVFAAAVNGAGFNHIVGAILAFVVALSNNFLLNRKFTFSDKRGHHAGVQAFRFVVVSLGAFVVNLIVLQVLVNGGMAEIPAQAIAITVATPMNFIGNRLWSFRG